jgi:hypothetical protein
MANFSWVHPNMIATRIGRGQSVAMRYFVGFFWNMRINPAAAAPIGTSSVKSNTSGTQNHVWSRGEGDSQHAIAQRGPETNGKISDVGFLVFEVPRSNAKFATRKSANNAAIRTQTHDQIVASIPDSGGPSVQGNLPAINTGFQSIPHSEPRANAGQVDGLIRLTWSELDALSLGVCPHLLASFTRWRQSRSRSVTKHPLF